MLRTIRTPTELSISIASNAGLELFWSLAAIGCAVLAMVSTHMMALAGAAAAASAFALLAHTGELAARWPRRADMPSKEAIGINVGIALAALGLGGLAIAGVSPGICASLALLLLSGLLVLDAPIEPELAAPRGSIAGGYMILAGLGSIIVLVAAFNARASTTTLVPWAALLVASAQLVGAVTLLARFARG